MSTTKIFHHGITLIELMVTIAVFAILSVVAAPAVSDFIDKARVRGAADALSSDLFFARSEAVLRNRTITVSITPGTAWCYGLHNAGTCDCTTAGSCSIKTVSAAQFQGTTLTSNYTSLAFDPLQGTISGVGGTVGTDTILFGNTLGQAGVKPSIANVAQCAPSSYQQIMGYPSC